MATKRTPATTPDEPRVRVDFGVLQRQRLTGREVREFERVQGVKYMAVSALFQAGEVPYDTLLALVWILHRRTDPDMTFDDMLDLREDEWAIDGINVTESDPTPEPADARTGS